MAAAVAAIEAAALRLCGSCGFTCTCGIAGGWLIASCWAGDDVEMLANTQSSNSNHRIMETNENDKRRPEQSNG